MGWTAAVSERTGSRQNDTAAGDSAGAGPLSLPRATCRVGHSWNSVNRNGSHWGSQVEGTSGDLGTVGAPRTGCGLSQPLDTSCTDHLRASGTNLPPSFCSLLNSWARGLGCTPRLGGRTLSSGGRSSDRLAESPMYLKPAPANVTPSQRPSISTGEHPPPRAAIFYPFGFAVFPALSPAASNRGENIHALDLAVPVGICLWVALVAWFATKMASPDSHRRGSSLSPSWSGLRATACSPTPLGLGPLSRLGAGRVRPASLAGAPLPVLVDHQEGQKRPERCHPVSEHWSLYSFSFSADHLP